MVLKNKNFQKFLPTLASYHNHYNEKRNLKKILFPLSNKQSRYHKLDDLRDAHYVGVGFVTSFDPGFYLFYFTLLKVHC